MNQILGLFTGVVLLFPLAVQASTAQATFFCCSLRCQRGLDPAGNYYLDLSSAPAVPNGELAPDFLDSGYSHSACVNLVDELLGASLAGQLALDLPNAGDLNRDGFDDFFQLDEGFTNLLSTGAYHLDFYGDGAITATWNRPAGSKDGSCALTLTLGAFNPVTFVIPFEVLEYRGSLVYARDAANVNSTISLSQTGDPTNWIAGSLLFTKSTEDSCNQLLLRPGIWTNQSRQIESFTSQTFTRDPRWPSNYCGFIEFDNQPAAATASPYSQWVLSINDSNDSNANQIPDLSDETGSAAIPRLALNRRGTNLVFTIWGSAGRIHQLQALADLGAKAWQNVAQLTLTNSSQEIELAWPSEKSKFWRIAAH